MWTDPAAEENGLRREEPRLRGLVKRERIKLGRVCRKYDQKEINLSMQFQKKMPN